MPKGRRIIGNTQAVTGKPDPVKARIAKRIERVSGQRHREAGMMLDGAYSFTPPYYTGYRMDSYRTSYAFGLGQQSGTYDIPKYFVMMNEQNGGMLYWPVTLAEKLSWYRFWARCIYLNDNKLGQILMADGTLKSIKDVQVGEEVLTALGTSRKVKNKYERRCVEDRAVTLKAWCLQNPLKTTHHHPYQILKRELVKKDPTHYHKNIDFQPEWIHAENVRPGDYVLMPAYRPAKFSDMSPEQAAFLGYYAAEGSMVWGARCVGTEKSDGKKFARGWKWHQKKIKVPVGISFAINKDELETVGKRIIALSLAVFGVTGKVVRERGNGVEILVSNSDAAEFCHFHVGEGSCDKKLSQELIDSTEVSKKAFLLAYAEGDGHHGIHEAIKGQLVIATASDSLAPQVQMMAISCGIMCRIAKYDRKNDEWSDKPIWHINIPSWSAKSLTSDSVKWKESDSKGEKHCAFIINGYAAFKVSEVTFSQEDDTVYNLEIDADGTDENSFVCNGMIVHNTDCYIGRGLDLLTDLPMSKMTLNMPKMRKDQRQLRDEIMDFFRWQLDKLNMFELCQSILWELNCVGNCFPADHLIHTPEGMLPICQIRQGDEVLTASGEYGKVVAISRRQVSEWLVDFDIARLPGIDFTPTEEHPVVVRKNGKDVMVLAKDVRVGDHIGIAQSNAVNDVSFKSVSDEIGTILTGRYDEVYTAVVNDALTVSVKYRMPDGKSFTNREMKDKVLSWVSSLSEPVVMTCEDVATKMGVSDVVKFRSAAYFLRKRGIIKTERTGAGKHGSSIRWFPLPKKPDISDFYGRDFEKVFETKILGFEIDEDFLYLLGYWLGDGWLWQYKRPTSYPYFAFDICVEKDTSQIERLEGVMESVFGRGEFAAGDSVVFSDDSMYHFTVEDVIFCAWWGHYFGFDCKSKKLPKWVMELPVEKQIWILRGMIDSDGFVSRLDDGAIVAGMVNTNVALMHQLFQIAIRCGIPMSFGKSVSDNAVMPDGSVRGKVSSMYLKTSESVIVRRLIRGCVKELPVVETSGTINPDYIEEDGKFYFRVNGIGRKYHDGPVFNLEVEGDHTYCANQIRTHNCFIFHEWDEKDKMWTKAVMLPPEEVYAFSYPFSDKTRIEYRPMRIMQIIKSSILSSGEVAQPESYAGHDQQIQQEIAQSIPPEMVEMVKENDAIIMDTDPMSGSFVSRISRRRTPYMDLGASLLERVLVPMLEKEHLRYTQLSLASRNMTPKQLITAPGLLPAELDDLRAQVDLSYLDPDYAIITNYEVNWQELSARDRLLDLQSEYDRLDNQIFAALGVTREIMTGESTYSGTKITTDILNTMFLLSREVIKSYVEKQLFVPICEKRGWYEEGPHGVKKYWHPKIGFNRLTIRDNAEVFDSLFQLYQKGSLPVEVIYELFNLDDEEMTERLRAELFTVKDSTFNRLLEEVHSDVGRAMVEKTDIVKRISGYLGVKVKKEGGEGGGIEGMGGAPQEAQYETPDILPGQPPLEPVEGTEQAKEHGSESNLDQIAEAAASKLPVDASDEQITNAIQEAEKAQETP